MANTDLKEYLEPTVVKDPETENFSSVLIKQLARAAEGLIIARYQMFTQFISTHKKSV